MNDPIINKDCLLVRSLKDNPKALESTREFFRKHGVDVLGRDAEMFELVLKSKLLNLILVSREKNNGNGN